MGHDVDEKVRQYKAGTLAPQEFLFNDKASAIGRRLYITTALCAPIHLMCRLKDPPPSLRGSKRLPAPNTKQYLLPKLSNSTTREIGFSILPPITHDLPSSPAPSPLNNSKIDTPAVSGSQAYRESDKFESTRQGFKFQGPRSSFALLPF